MKTPNKLNMKYYEYNFESDRIEFYNSYLGIETVLVNGKKVSEKFSVTGTEHFFKVNSAEIILTTEYELFKERKFNLYLEKGGELIDLKYIELNKRYRLVILIFGLLVGFCLINLYNYFL